MVGFEVSVIYLKKLFLLRRSRLANTQGVSACQPRMPDTRAFAAQSSQFFQVNYRKSQRPTWNISCKLFSQMGRDYWARQSNKDRRFRHEGLAHRYVCSLAKVVPHAKLRSFTLLFYISANGSLVYPVLYMSISHFLSQALKFFWSYTSDFYIQDNPISLFCFLVSCKISIFPVQVLYYYYLGH